MASNHLFFTSAKRRYTSFGDYHGALNQQDAYALQIEYTRHEMEGILETVADGNKNNGGLQRKVSACGILGMLHAEAKGCVSMRLPRRTTLGTGASPNADIPFSSQASSAFLKVTTLCS
jgi:hypothetical protein